MIRVVVDGEQGEEQHAWTRGIATQCDPNPSPTARQAATGSDAGNIWVTLYLLTFTQTVRDIGLIQKYEYPLA